MRGRVAEMCRHKRLRVMLDSTGQYGAGLAVEGVGLGPFQPGAPCSQVVVAGDLGWHRGLQHGQVPASMRGFWANLQHDAGAPIDYSGNPGKPAQIRPNFPQGALEITPARSRTLKSKYVVSRNSLSGEWHPYR